MSLWASSLCAFVPLCGCWLGNWWSTWDSLPLTNWIVLQSLTGQQWQSLFNLWLTNMYSHTEEQWLAYILQEHWFHGHEVHANDAIAAGNNDNNEEDFHPDIKLPASFVSSQAWSSEQTTDAMALSQNFGKLTFFCTMTFNPDWPEVQECLEPGQSISDIPIVVAWVFKSWLEKVLHLLLMCFGAKKYMIKVIEFQKCGFPHADIIIKVCMYGLMNHWGLISLQSLCWH